MSGSRTPLRAVFREWAADGPGEIAPALSPPGRRIVDLSLPSELKDHSEDLVFLTRLARLVCELTSLYVQSGGQRSRLTSGPLHNVFSGGPGVFGPPEPFLFGPRMPGFKIEGLRGV